MRCTIAVCAVLTLASVAYAKDPKAYQTGKIVQMDSVQCGVAEKAANNLTGNVLGGDSTATKTHEILCQEYLLQTDRVLYRIRPRDEVHPVLLPLDERAQFRFQKDKMILRAEDFNGKEREYTVVSMTPRTDDNTADAAPAHVNHLQ
ncbi:MAG TPA: hypothetical protein VMD76_05965 [Candidatus Sulfotelmatobacter sp.]|jgi:hypothetical protein|nr:hypothetical protein [Candidatus Sulfotelmatobacter sp.]